MISILSKIKNSKMISKNKSEFILSMIAQLTMVFQLILQNKMLATYLTKSEYGDWALFLSIYVLISMLPFTAFDQALSRLGYQKFNSDEKYKFVNGVYIIYLLIFLIYFGGIKIILNTFMDRSMFNTMYISFIIYTFSEIFKNSLLIIDNASRNRKRVASMRLFDLLFRILGMLILLNLNQFMIENILILFVIGNTIAIISSLEKFDKVFKHLDYNYIKTLYKVEIIPFSLPVMIGALFSWFQNMINRWFLSYYLDSETVALYSILISLSFFIPNALYGVVSNFFLPYICSQKEKATVSLYKRYLGSVGLMLFAYVIFSFFAKEYLIIILADAKYIEIAPMIPILSISGSIYIVAMLSTFEMFRRGDVKVLLYPVILSGSSSVIIGYFAVGKFGLNGAIVAGMMSQILYSSVTLIISYRHITN